MGRIICAMDDFTRNLLDVPMLAIIQISEDQCGCYSEILGVAYSLKSAIKTCDDYWNAQSENYCYKDRAKLSKAKDLPHMVFEYERGLSNQRSIRFIITLIDL